MSARPPVVDAGFVADALEAMVRIPSVNPALVPGAPEIAGARPGLEVDRGAEVVRALHRAYVAVVGAEPAYTGAPYWCDAALLAAAGVPAVVFGPGGAGAHAQVEYVDLPSTVTCARVLAGAIGEFCGLAA